MSGNTTFGT